MPLLPSRPLTAPLAAQVHPLGPAQVPRFLQPTSVQGTRGAGDWLKAPAHGLPFGGHVSNAPEVRTTRRGESPRSHQGGRVMTLRLGKNKIFVGMTGQSALHYSKKHCIKRKSSFSS